MLDFLAQNWWYLLLIGGFAFMMFRGGGCCGGMHSNNRDDHMGHNNGSSGRYSSGMGGGCCGGGHENMGYNGDNGQYGSGQEYNRIEMVRDPVCGMTVNPDTAIKQNINGVMYYFCSEGCRSSFVSKH